MTMPTNSGAILSLEATGDGPDGVELALLVRRGLPYSSFEAVAAAFSLSRSDLAAAAGISVRTLARRKRDGRLSPQESDGLSRVARVLAHAVRVFEDNQRVSNWIQRPNRALAMIPPLNLLGTDAGADTVDRVLGRIEFSVYS